RAKQGRAHKISIFVMAITYLGSRIMASSSLKDWRRAMSRIRNMGLALGGAVWATSAASAASPVALIEELSGNPAGLELMEYLETGRIVRLRTSQTII